MITTIEITEEDIDCGEAGNPWKCMVALGVRRKVLPDVEVAVGETVVAIGGVDVGLPPEAVRAIVLFDEFLPVGPLRFPLDIPDRFLAEGGR